MNKLADISIDVTEAGTGTFYQFEPDVYDAIVSGIEEVDNPFEENATQLEWTFEVPGYQNEDGTVATKRGWCNPVINAKSKMYGWIEAILGTPPGVGEAFRTSTLIGKPCRITLNKGTNQKGEKIVKLTDVLGPKAPANGKAKPGLIDRLKADPPAGTTIVDENVCSLPKCKREVFMFDNDGVAYCEKHAPDDDE